jgi:hypothetical protein
MNSMRCQSDAKRNETGGGPAGNAIAPGIQPLFSVDHGFGFPFSFLGCFLTNLWSVKN